MGDSHSQAMLSRIYAMGEGVSKDLAKAHMWVNFAAIDGAKKRDMRDSLSKVITAAEISEAQDMVCECVKTDYKGC